ncbi:cytochrome C oxidase subunit IV family protein [Penaeicola halotolerans]|uniref:cytochrome C oxidase subunit IV family protein n=1 Tax=Penaeicola halotolerans TaxID=2793196 RepID=UPI001CF827C6|nr:cytochrome C oxidase subunit IV family protein [Penaeicola halotolerans]
MDSFDNQHKTLEVIPANKEKIQKIWKIALILLVVTLVEFVFAFTMERGLLLYSIFIGLTLVKAAYIVMEFMHLKEESKALFWSIVIPLLFVVWLVIALLNEGGAISIYR